MKKFWCIIIVLANLAIITSATGQNTIMQNCRSCGNTETDLILCTACKKGIYQRIKATESMNEREVKRQLPVQNAPISPNFSTSGEEGEAVNTLSTKLHTLPDDEWTSTKLLPAIDSGEFIRLQAVLAAKPKLAYALDYKKQSVLMHLCILNYYNAAKNFLEQYFPNKDEWKEYINLRQVHGKNAVFFAAQESHLYYKYSETDGRMLIQYLINEGADIFVVSDQNETIKERLTSEGNDVMLSIIRNYWDDNKVEKK